MERILITGAESYIGDSFARWLGVHCPDCSVFIQDVRTDDWKQLDFSAFDTVLHVAGIVHQKQTDENRSLYFRVNRDLTLEIAEAAKAAGVKQFLFLSTMSVYQKTQGMIGPATPPVGGDAYGQSKLEAEQGLALLRDADFCVAVLRPPMIYGPGCKGNFRSLIRIALGAPMFPIVQNRRSMLYIDHLCAFLKLCIDRRLDGVFFPQNAESVNTTQMARWIASANGKKLHASRLLGLLVRAAMPFSAKLQKAFGSLTYEGTEVFNFEYDTVSNEASVRVSAENRGEGSGR